MEDWRKSRGHLLFLREFLKPRHVDNIHSPFGVEWKLMLGEEPKAAIKSFLDSGVLKSASLSDQLRLTFKVAELKDMLKSRGLKSSGRNKQELILRLIQTHPEDMKQEVTDLTVLKCSEKGEQLVERFFTTEEEPPIRDDIHLTEKAKGVTKWILDKAIAGVIGGAAYHTLRELSEAETPASGLFTKLPKSFYNPFEYGAEYILIPGGQYRYSVTKKMETVQDLYFAKYHLKHKCYCRFIRYLQDKERELLRVLPKGEFDRRMLEFASSIEGFATFLGNNPNSWPKKLRSTDPWSDDTNHGDSYVNGVSWFSARAYCYWLSALDEKGSDLVLGHTGGQYRLPTEIEWEWACSGGTRKHPTPDVADRSGMPAYRKNNTTPEGLKGMTGGPCQWMENWIEGYEGKRCALRGGMWRGGTWHDCFSRLSFSPDGHDIASGGLSNPCYGLFIGFRVVLAQT